MRPAIEHLEKIVRIYTRRLEGLSDEKYAWKREPGKWSKKEILGHLVDSAMNNIRRFIVAQYEDSPIILYQQDLWVKITDYQHYPTRDLITLWNLLNRHICIVLTNMSPDITRRTCSMGGQPQTMEWVIADYINHLLHHLHQILDLEPITYS